jgi:hypothetical protein
MLCPPAGTRLPPTNTGVEDHGIGLRLGVDRQLRPADGGQPLLPAQTLHFVEALGMPRREHEQRVGARGGGPHPVERANDDLFFALRRASGDEDLTRRRHPEEAQHPFTAAARPERWIQRVELQAARDDDPAGIGAERRQAAGGLLALHAEAIDIGEHAPEERTNQPVSTEGTCRDAAVDHERAHTSSAALTQEVGPDLRLHHDEELRGHQLHCPPDRQRPVEREVEDTVDIGHAALGHLLAREGRGGEEDAQLRITATELADQRPNRHHLADRDRMNPDRFVPVEIERHRQIAEPLTEAADVLVVPQRLIQEVRREDHGDEERDNAVKEVHGETTTVQLLLS